MYLLYECDVWKAKSSFILIGVFSSEKILKQKLKKEMERPDFNYSELEKVSIESLNNILINYYIKKIEINTIFN